MSTVASLRLAPRGDTQGRPRLSKSILGHPGASFPTGGLWILPEAWKTPRQDPEARTSPQGVSHTSLDGATGAAHRLHRPLPLGLCLDYDRPRQATLTKEAAI